MKEDVYGHRCASHLPLWYEQLLEPGTCSMLVKQSPPGLLSLLVKDSLKSSHMRISGENVKNVITLATNVT